MLEKTTMIIIDIVGRTTLEEELLINFSAKLYYL